MPCDLYLRPAALDVDYGVPTGLCGETSANSRVSDTFAVELDSMRLVSKR